MGNHILRRLSYLHKHERMSVQYPLPPSKSIQRIWRYNSPRSFRLSYTN